jgi:hypothetical protein
MASSIQLLRSNNPNERPFPGNLLDGQPAINTNAEEPGLFFKATDGSIVKIGPAAITSDGNPPNTGGTGQPGNTIGELWLDKSLPIPVLKVYDGVQWVDAGSGSGGSPGIVTLQRWVKTASGGETSVSGPDNSSQILSYTPGLEEVFLNGVLLTRGVDYTADSGISITSLVPLTAGDEVTVLGWTPFNILGSIDGSNLIDESVSGAKLANNAITSAKIADGSIVNEDINVSANILASKLSFTQAGSGAVARTVDNKLKDVVSVKDFGAIGDGVTDDAAAIQAAIDFAATLPNGLVVIPPGIYKCAVGLQITSGRIGLIGAKGKSKLEFNISSGQTCLSVVGVGHILESFEIAGNLTTVGLRLNGSPTQPGSVSTRLSLRDLRISNHNIGLNTTYSWSNVYSHCELFGCNLGWQAGTQTNNIATVGLRFVNCGQFATFQTCEGISLIGPQFQNISNPATEYALTLRQSTVTMTDPYIENISNAEIARIGGPGDLIGCTFISFGGIWPGDKSVFYRESLNHNIRIEGARVTGIGTKRIGISTLSTSGYWPLLGGALENTNDNVKTFNAVVTQQDFSSATFANATTNTRYKDYLEFNRTGGTTYSTDNLTPGDPYTVVVAIKSDVSANVRWRDGFGTILQTLGLGFPSTSDEWTVWYFPLYATGQRLELIFGQGTNQLKYIGIHKGHVFPSIDINRERTLKGVDVPSSGAWDRGDRIFNANATAEGLTSWVCTSSGSPGTWIPEYTTAAQFDSALFGTGQTLSITVPIVSEGVTYVARATRHTGSGSSILSLSYVTFSSNGTPTIFTVLAGLGIDITASGATISASNTGTNAALRLAVYRWP